MVCCNFYEDNTTCFEVWGGFLQKLGTMQTTSLWSLFIFPDLASKWEGFEKQPTHPAKTNGWRAPKW